MAHEATGVATDQGGSKAVLPSDTSHEPGGWADRHFVLFAFLGAIGVLFHEAQWYTFTDYFGTLLATGGALLVVCRPTSIWRWAVMHLGILVEVVEKGPFSSNHTVFHMFLSLSLLMAVAGRLVTNGFRPLSRDEVFRVIAPVGRVMILVLYFFTFWHKFNWGMLDPAVSCGGHYYDGLRDHLPFLPDGDWTIWPSIIGTLAAELGLFLLLLIRRTRVFGLFFVLIFHGVVGSMNHPNFSAIAYGYLILFFPMEGSGNFVRRWQGVLKKAGVDLVERRQAWFVRLRILSWVGTAAALAWIVYAAAVIVPNKELPVTLLREPWEDYRNLLQRNLKNVFQVYGTLIFFGVYVVGVWRSGWTWPRPFFRFRQPWVYLFPVLMFAHGMGPYFGGRTDSAFSMFSNLVTEPGHANHVFLSWVPQFGDLQADRVTIVASSDPELAEFAPRYETGPDGERVVLPPKKPYALHWFELQRYVQRKVKAGEGEFSVSYLRGDDMLGVIEADRETGRLVEVANAGEDAELNEPHSLFMMKYMYLRPYKHAERNTCGH